MKFKLFLMAVLSGLALMGSNAVVAAPAKLDNSSIIASGFSKITPTAPGTLTLNSDVYSYSPYANVESIWGYDGNFKQDVKFVEEIVEDVYDVTVDLVTSGNFQSATINSQNAFNYLAIHVGQGELLFRFFDPIKQFSIVMLDNTKAGGLSNFRAFIGADIPNPNPVPVPAAVWLFGSALAGLGVTKRKAVKA